ncbi:Ppx/GppA family phosphatase [Sneathiella aquimaris]|uniref:Ppx/GppA family phosphatase n=1 Tax=Sneathiella aquimaris TaxID=2599305 RepID=UPI00146A4E61|nr:Ppx/GppA family phosphatase [Sneathiella aquimaris]
MQDIVDHRDRSLDPEVKSSKKLTAVIDIGSNSVRLVVFDGPSRVPMPKFNEKVLCGLGRDLGSSQLLGQDAMDQAMAALRRYAALVNQMGIDRVLVAATAAVREADNGSEFVADVEQECDFNVQVLSGKQEARYAGLGVLSGMPYAHGLVGDLGGGSLELVKVDDHRIENTATLPLGALRLWQMDMDNQQLADYLNDYFSKVDWLSELKGKNFYVVGGAWRALARYHISKTGHSLNIIHNYKLSLPEMLETISEVKELSDDYLRAMPLVPKSRVSTMRTAAIIMEQLFTIITPKSIIFSANGLREGMLFSELKKPVRKRDPLLEACRDMAAREGRFAEHGEEIFSWMKGAFYHIPEKGQRLALASATLSDIAWLMSTDYRAPQAFRRIFRAPFSGIGHKGRAIVALAVYARYRGNLDGNAPEDGLALVSEEERGHSLSLGLALRLSHTLSGGTIGILPRTKLTVEGDVVVLYLPEDLSMLRGVHVESRLNSLAASFNKTSEIRIMRDR